MTFFISATIVTFIGFLFALFLGGIQAFLLTFLLALLEITLSFDNALVNATILQKMNHLWQQRFFCWGIIIAVFFTRLIFPLLIVSISTDLSMWDSITLAFSSPHIYSKHLQNAHESISTFGGIFLLLAFLTFFLNQNKKEHWFFKIEKNLVKIGELKFIPILFSLLLVFVIQKILPKSHHETILISGGTAIGLFLILNYFNQLLNQKKIIQNGKQRKNGFFSFIYLEILDISYSLDSVISAFAISTDLLIVCIGLSIGAIFVRSITLYLVAKKTIKKYRYLKHGAYYAIGTLGSIMIVNIFIEVPSILTVIISTSFILTALFASIRSQ